MSHPPVFKLRNSTLILARLEIYVNKAELDLKNAQLGRFLGVFHL